MSRWFAHRLLVVVPASVLAALGWLPIGITGGRSLAADVTAGKLKSALPVSARQRALARRGNGLDRPPVGGGPGLLPPIARARGPMIDQPPLGPTGPTGIAPFDGGGIGCGVSGPGQCFVGEFNSVSCATASSCTAVGDAPGAAFFVSGRITLAEGWDGTSWTVQPTPIPSGSPYNAFDAVSCPAPTACLAVGNFSGDGPSGPFAESSNGSTWTIRPPPPVPGASNTTFNYVQCASASACMVVGSYSDSSGNVLPLVEFWAGGSSWTIQTAPLPTGASTGALYGVSCPSTAACTAVGEYRIRSTSRELSLAEAWNGSSWSPTPNQPSDPATATSATLNAVWCFSGTSCSAVGQYLQSGGGTLTLAEGWDGKNWTIQTTNNPAGSSYNAFANVSCNPSAAGPPGAPCQAVGSSSGGPLVESWDGTNWSQPEPTPSPTGATLRDVSCTAANACTAVGSYLDTTLGNSGATSTLAERWRTGWSTQPTPNAALVAVGDATNVGSSSATLTATVYPEGATVSSCYFDYRSTSSLGSSVPCAQSVGGGKSPVTVSADLTGLTPNTTYSFDIVAANAAGTENGEPFANPSFTTTTTGSAPTVTTLSAVNVTPSAATLTGSVNPNGSQVTNCYFQYGPTSSYGSIVLCGQAVGAVTSPVDVSTTLSGLTPGATYHFQLVASTAGGTIYGGDTSFALPGPTGYQPNVDGLGFVNSCNLGFCTFPPPSPSYDQMAGYYPGTNFYHCVVVLCVPTITGSIFYNVIFSQLYNAGQCYAFAVLSDQLFGTSPPTPPYLDTDPSGSASALGSTGFAGRLLGPRIYDVLSGVESTLAGAGGAVDAAHEYTHTLVVGNAAVFNEIAADVANGPVVLGLAPTPGAFPQYASNMHTVLAYATGTDPQNGDNQIEIYNPNDPATGPSQAYPDYIDITPDGGVLLFSDPNIGHGVGAPGDWLLVPLPSDTWTSSFNNLWLPDAVPLLILEGITPGSPIIGGVPFLSFSAAVNGTSPTGKIVTELASRTGFTGSVTAAGGPANVTQLVKNRVAAATPQSPVAGSSSSVRIAPDASAVEVVAGSRAQRFDLMLGDDVSASYGREVGLSGVSLPRNASVALSSDSTAETFTFTSSLRRQESVVGSFAQVGTNAGNASVVVRLPAGHAKATLRVHDWNALTTSRISESITQSGRTHTFGLAIFAVSRATWRKNRLKLRVAHLPRGDRLKITLYYAHGPKRTIATKKRAITITTPRPTRVVLRAYRGKRRLGASVTVTRLPSN